MNSRVKNNSGLCIVVMGYIIRMPLGGLAWHYLQYVLGLTQLGYEVYYVEDSDDYPSCYDPQRLVVDTDPLYGNRFISSALDRLNLKDRWTYYDAHTRQWIGPQSCNIGEIAKRCDLLINVSGMSPLRNMFSNIPTGFS